MTTVTVVILLICIGGMILSVWGLINNERTYRHKIILLKEDHWYEDVDGQLKHKVQNISYKEHFWRLMMFQNNWRDWYK